RWFAIFSYSRAKARRAFALFALPFLRRENRREARLIFRSARRKKRGFLVMRPSESVAKRSNPTSIPTTVSVSIAGFGRSGRSNSTSSETCQLPVASRLNVALFQGYATG